VLALSPTPPPRAESPPTIRKKTPPTKKTPPPRHAGEGGGVFSPPPPWGGGRRSPTNNRGGRPPCGVPADTQRTKASPGAAPRADLTEGMSSFVLAECGWGATFRQLCPSPRR